MKFITKNRTILAGSMLLAVAVLGLSMAAFPSSAHAQYTSAFYNLNNPANSVYGAYGCAFPTVYQNGYWSCNTGSVTVVQPQQSTNYIYPPSYQPPQYQPLSGSCYPNSSSVSTGQTVQWVASPIGGNGQFSYNWSGTDGLSGTGQTASMAYYSAGSKTAQVTIYSAGQSATISCNNYVTVYNSQPTYPSYPQYYSPLAVSCVVNTNYASIGNGVTWSASATGGNGYYNYSWSGTDGIYGYGNAISYSYNSPGTKYASVTVTSNGQTLTQPCSNFVTVGGPVTGNYYGYSVNYNSNSSGLDVACYPDPSSASINQPVNWRAEVTGGTGQYTYSWAGSNDLTGNSSSVIKYYSTAGTKSAIVTVVSSDGRASTRACSATLTVRGAAGAAPAQPQPTVQSTSQTSLTGASIFSLSGIPWGWVAVLIILVLFATVMYLLFNKPKI
ncbi:MAG TPA: hypothetical protein VF438_02005 [Candidatus Paceibacterota bacterium]